MQNAFAWDVIILLPQMSSNEQRLNGLEPHPNTLSSEGEVTRAAGSTGWAPSAPRNQKSRDLARARTPESRPLRA